MGVRIPPSPFLKKMNKSNLIMNIFIIVVGLTLFLLSLWSLQQSRFLEAIVFFLAFGILIFLFFRFNEEYFDTSQADSVWN